jgi:hypothetical protein
MHAYFESFASGLTINGQNATTAYLGGLFGLDGIHPTNTGYALLANQFITATNTAFALSTGTVDVNAVAKTDPYFGTNIKPIGGQIFIPHAAGMRSSELIRGWKGCRLRRLMSRTICRDPDCL